MSFLQGAQIFQVVFALIVVGLTTASAVQPADAETKYHWSQFSKVGRWDIWKAPIGCSASTRTLNDLLAFQLGKDRAVVSLINDAMEIPPGKYPIGLELGPPNDFAGTVQAVVAADKPHKVAIEFSIADMTKVAGAGWVQLTLGSHKHFVNTGEGIEAIRMIKVCEVTASDPFKRAGGGLLP